MVNTTWMADTTSGGVNNIPANAPFVGGYVSGLNGVEWGPNQWNRFSGTKIRIYQGIGPIGPHDYDEIDVESEAVTPQQAAQLHKIRVDAGIGWTNIYGTDSSIQQTNQAIIDLGGNYWIGHVTCRLANWDLDEEHATALVGTSIHGATCVGVQWASDSSNPNTLIPGTNITLKAGNVDLSVVDATWVPSFTAPPPAPPQASRSLVVVTAGFSDGSSEEWFHN